MRKLDAAIIVCITIAQIVEDTYSIVVHGLYDENKIFSQRKNMLQVAILNS